MIREKEGRRKRSRDKEERRPRRIFRKKHCRFCFSKVKNIDYLDTLALRKLTTERGKILPSKITGNCARHQRQAAKAIKRSRQIGLLPYVAK